MTASPRVNLSAGRLELLANLLRAEGVDRTARQAVVRRADPSAPAPLTFAQRRLWFLDRFTANRTAYVIPATLRVRGDFRPEAFSDACAEVVRRHEALRTVFFEVEGRPFQQVRPDLPPEVRVVDLRDRPAQARAQEVSRRTERLLDRPFDLSTGPLLRVELLRCTGDETLVLLAIHHIVADQWSMGVLMRDLVELYSARISGGAAQLSELAIQYPDFAAWQQDPASTAGWAAELSYWVQRLAGAPAETGLPLSRPRPKEKTYRGAGLPVELPAALVAKLRALARDEGATVFMVLAATLAALLYRVSDSEDVVIGTPVANRPLAEIEPLIGFFVNILALRTDLSGNPTFRDLLQRVRGGCLEAFEHQAVPFERVVEEVQPERSLSRTPLFQVMFSYQNVPFPAWNHGALQVQPLAVESRTAKFDLLLDLFEDGPRIWGRLEYSVDILDEDRARRLVGYFRRLLQALVADPDQRIGEVALLGPDERRAVAALGRGPVAEWPDAGWAHELFERQARVTPDAVAVRFAGTDVSYAELNRRANRWAHRLRRLGVDRDVLVGVSVERSVEQVVGLLAVLKAGGAYVPLDPAYPRARLADMLDDSRVPILLTQRRVLAGLPPVTACVLCLDDPAQEPAAEPDTDLAVPLRAGDLAYVIYTSGSTGRPKGVLNVHGALRNLVLWMQDLLPLDARDRLLVKTPITFDASVIEYFWPLIAGAALVVARPDGHKDSRYLVDTIEAEAATVLQVVPSMLHLLVGEPGLARCPSLRYLLAGGEELTRELQEAFFARSGADLVNFYGPTETAVNATAWVCRRDDDPRPVPIGFPAANSYTFALDRFGRPVPVGVAGELYIGGPGVARGYLNRPELTAERFIPDPFATDPAARMYRTGDLARYRDDGAIEYLGRLDHQVKLRGFRIELGEVEAVLAGHPSVRRAIAMVRTVGAGDARLVAYVSGAPELTAAELTALVKQRLPQYMVPSAFVFLPQLPILPNGKVDRNALPAPALSRPELDSAYVAPRDPVERSIAEIWARLLGIARVGSHDNFFELGGHSLLATQLAAQIGTAHGVRPPIRDLFDNPTVAGQAAWVRAQTASGAAAAGTIPVADRDGALPLSFPQERLYLRHPVAVDDPYHNVVTAVRIAGRLDAATLTRSLDDLVRRHEALRTRIVGDASSARQVVDAGGRWPLAVVDLRHLDQDDRTRELHVIVEDEAHRSFRPAEGPLIHGAVVTTAPDEVVLVLTMHHLVTDNWSYGVLVRDLAELYEAHVVGREPRLPELPIQYPDFAKWQRDQLASGAFDEHLRYWRAQLADAPGTPGFAVPDHQRGDGASGYTHAFRLGAAARDGLAAIGRPAGATLFMVLLAAFDVLLYAYSGSTDLVVTFPESGRQRAETEDLVGYFVNNLAQRCDLSGDPTFRELVAQVRERTLAAHDHQGVALRSSGQFAGADPSRIAFNLLNASVPALNLYGLRAEPLTTEGAYVFAEVLTELKPAEVDLALIMREDGDGLRGMWLYSPERIDARVLEVLTRQWAPLVDLVVARPDRTIGDLTRELRQGVR